MILWDFDGTLAYTVADVWTSVEYAAEQCGGHLPQAFMAEDSNVAKPIREIYRQVTPYPGDERFEEFDEWIRRHYRFMSSYEKTYLYPGIEDLLRDLRAEKVQNYIITMKPQQALERILEKKGWSGFFDGWFSPDSFTGEDKTKSELIARVTEQTGYAREDYVYIGDTWSDVLASKENRIACIAVTYGDGNTEQLLAQQPDYCVDEACRLREILKEGD